MSVLSLQSDDETFLLDLDKRVKEIDEIISSEHRWLLLNSGDTHTSDDEKLLEQLSKLEKRCTNVNTNN